MRHCGHEWFIPSGCHVIKLRQWYVTSKRTNNNKNYDILVVLVSVGRTITEIEVFI